MAKVRYAYFPPLLLLQHVSDFFHHFMWQAKAAAVEDDDDGIADLRERIAAYNFDSSPDRSEGKVKDLR